ncbi:MAG: MBOAT family protein [Lachnospiraceae bacterium]|nr:MBOAT family protein [Lachnospiraceae bacterium]
MLFSSLIFIMVFLPVVFIGSRILHKNRYVNVFLLLASLFFYAWGEPVYVLLMLASIIVNYFAGLLMDKKRDRAKLILVLDTVFNLGLLGFFKYASFGSVVLVNYFHVPMTPLSVSLPIGISFFTFQIMSYSIDLYRGKFPVQKNIINLALYISFFPQLIAGPIVRYEDINDQLENRVVTIEKSVAGIERFIIGLGKKVIIANTVAEAADRIYAYDPSRMAASTVWVASILYTLQIYYDFSGYSDMAIGLGKMFGFEFLENFNYPYMSKSVSEFWRRWHISLGTWFREYLYIPLGGNRKGKVRSYVNLMIVFFLTGFWHGAGFTFIFWGIYHGLFRVIERLGFSKVLEKCRPLAWIYTFFVVNLGWVFFRVGGLRNAFVIVSRMFTPGLTKYYSLGEMMSHRCMIIAVLGILGAGLIQLIPAKVPAVRKIVSNPVARYIWCAFVFGVCIMLLASNTYNPFIYFRF